MGLLSLLGLDDGSLGSKDRDSDSGKGIIPLVPGYFPVKNHPQDQYPWQYPRPVDRGVEYLQKSPLPQWSNGEPLGSNYPVVPSASNAMVKSGKLSVNEFGRHVDRSPPIWQDCDQ